jgi:CRISPR/Cas system CSM-associated protein Csm4 (group 5 of RAMP superfamily)
VAAYVDLARNHFNVDEFESFCAEHLSQLDEVANEFFASDTVHNAIRDKVSALYPDDEIESFVELFWDRIQTWRQVEGAGVVSRISS